METVAQNLTNIHDSIDNGEVSSAAALSPSTKSNSLEKENFYFENFGLTKKSNCNFCRIMCNSKTTLESHIMGVHSKKKLMECEKCNFKCSTKTDLKIHVKSHKKSRVTNKSKNMKARSPDYSPKRFPITNSKKIGQQKKLDDGSSGSNLKARPSKIPIRHTLSKSKRTSKSDLKILVQKFNTEKLRGKRMREVIKLEEAKTAELCERASNNSNVSECKETKSEQEKIAEFKVDSLKIIGNIDDLLDKAGRNFQISFYRNINDGKLQCSLAAEGIIKNSDLICESIDKSNRQEVASSKSKPLFKCKDCDFSSKNKYVLRRHEFMHHETEKPFACPTCNFKSTSMGGLKNHGKKHVA